MQRTITPFRITVILDGNSAVAQLENMERVIDDDGSTISSRALPPEPLVYPLSSEVLGATASAALARVTELEADLATATTAKTDAEAAQASAESAQATAEAQAATLTEQLATAQAQLDALLNPPAVVTIRSWQAKAVLSLAGLLATAEAVIDALDEPQRTVVKSAWDNNADFSRQSSTVLALAAALSLTDDQLDAMFAQAAELTV